MTHRERLERHLNGDAVDRILTVGGWILGVWNLAAIGGIPVEEYLADPWRGVLLANRRLDVDGMVLPIVPTELDSIRAGALQESHFVDVDPEVMVERAGQIPRSAEAVLAAKFNPAAVEAEYRAHFESLLQQLGDIALIPTLWRAPVNFSLYFEYGYVAFLTAAALYPEAIGRIWWEDAVLSRERNHIIIRLMQEYHIFPCLLTGDDICNNDGPMVSPIMLREYYWPQVKWALEPFVEAGIRMIHHCDGNVMPLVDDMIAAGFSGFQGFQYECGVEIGALRTRRSLRGESMLILGGLSVTRTLPYGTPDDVRREVDYCLDATSGGRGFCLFTSNVTGVEVPPANLLAAYDYLRTCTPSDMDGEGTLTPPALAIEPAVQPR